MKALLTFTAILEAATGLALLGAPSEVARLLLGSALESPAPLAVARIAGAALLAIGVHCWSARNHAGERFARGVVAGMLLYNCGVVAVLACGALSGGDGRLHGVALWPVVVLHAAFAAWCIACLAPRRNAPAKRPEQPE